MADIKNTFTQGKMNKDLDERLIPNGQYRDAMNVQVTTSDSSNLGVLQNISGNSMVNTGESLGSAGFLYWTATGKCVGAIADEQNDKIYYFIHDSSVDVIMELDIDGTSSPVLIDQNGDVLKFTGNTITAINVIDGLLYWTDNNSEPKKVNINRFKTATSSTGHTQIDGRDVQERDITVIKKKPTKAPLLGFSTKIRDGWIGYQDTITEQYYGIVRDRNLAVKVAGDEVNIFMECESNIGAYNYRVGDRLVLNPSSEPVYTQGSDQQCRVVVKEVFEMAGPGYSNYTNTGYRQRLVCTVEMISSTIATGSIDWYAVLQDTSITINDKKLFRFSTRFKYIDGEYSAIGPWTQTAFLSSKYLYAPTKEPYNLGMQNAAKSIILKQFSGGDTPHDVEQIDILYKEEDSNTIYVIDTLKIDDPPINTPEFLDINSTQHNNWTYMWDSSTDITVTYGFPYDVIEPKYTGKYIVSSQNIIAALPDDQLLRNWDKVPIKALAQEIVANRLIYGNYTKNYSLDSKPSLNCQLIDNIDYPGNRGDLNFLARGHNSIKTLREYQVGVVFSDNYGRETPVFTSDSASITSPFYFEHPKQISAYINSFTTPDWAVYYKFYIKETSGEYYNLAMDRAYLADKDQNLWISFPSSDRNKVKEEDYLILKKPKITDGSGDGWEIGIGEGITLKNKYKIIDIKNEAPEFIKKKYYSLGTASETSSTSLKNDLFGGNNYLPKAGRRLIGIDKYYWSKVFYNQELIPDDKGVEENILAIQFSKPGVAPGSTVLSERYEVLSVTYNGDESAYNNTAATDTLQYDLYLKEPIKDSDDWVQTAANTPNVEMTIEIFKVEKKNLQEFEGRFFIKIMGDELTKQYVESLQASNFTTLSSQSLLVLTDTDYVSGTGTSGNDSTVNQSDWASLLYSHDSNSAGFFIDAMSFSSGQSMANNSIGCSGIITGTPTDVISDNAHNSLDTDRDTLVSGLHGGIFTPSGWGWSAGSSSDLSDMGERSFRSQPQELLTPVGQSPTDQKGTRRFLYTQNKPYMTLSFSGCGVTLCSENENFPVKSSSNTPDKYYQFKPSTCGPLHSTTSDWVTEYTSDGNNTSDISYQYDLDGTSDQGWIRFPNYTNASQDAYMFDGLLWPEIKPTNNSPNNYYHSSAKKKWRTMWDPTVDSSGNVLASRKEFVDQLIIGKRFYFEDDPDENIYTIEGINTIRLYNHTSFRTTWLEDTSAASAAERLVKRHMVSGYNNNSVEEALLAYLNDADTAASPSSTINVDIDGNAMDYEGESSRLEYLQKMVYRFGHRNNRRLVYILRLDQDPTGKTWYPTQDITSNSTLSGMVFVDNNLAEDDPGLPESPAIWETEPKKDRDLDIYYEASDNIPLQITKENRELLVPAGSSIFCINGNDWSNAGENWDHEDMQGLAPTPTLVHWQDTSAADPYYENEAIIRVNNLYLNYEDNSGTTKWVGNTGTSTSPASSGATGNADKWIVEDLGWDFANAFGPEGGMYIRFDKEDGSFVTLKVKDIKTHGPTGASGPGGGQFAGAGPGSSGPDSERCVITHIALEELDNHELSYGINWSNCINFGNGVESDRIRDDFNAVQMATGIKTSTTVPKYTQETKKNGLIFSSIYNPTGKINGFNEFIQANKITKELTPTYGSIQKLFTRDNDLLAFCEDKVVRIYADKDIIYNADGNTNVTATNKVLGQSHPFEGEFGISKNPESFASESFRVYFTDKNRRSVLRLSKDGITRISDYGMSDWFSDSMSGASELLGSFDYDKQEYNLKGVEDKVVSFSESVRGWTSFKSFTSMEHGISLSNNYYTFKMGAPYIHHDENVDKNTFYGTHTPSSVTVILNEAPDIVKNFKTLFYDGTESKITSQTSQMENSLFGEYYNLSSQNGWYIDSISTDQSGFNYTSDSPFELKGKEGRWYNYIRGNSLNFDLSNFNFQGIGEKKTI